MKISLYYESNYKRDYTWLEVPEEEFTVMIENDYQERLAKAKDGETVERRTPQEILDEECNKPTYNSHRKAAERSVSLDEKENCETLLCDAAVTNSKRKNGNKYEYGKVFLTNQKSLEEEVFGSDGDELYAALAALPQEQRDLILRVYADGVNQQVIVKEEGVSKSAISHRMERAVARLRRELNKNSEKI